MKKILRDRDATMPLTDDELDGLLKEVGDCLWYCAAIAHDLGSTLAEVARRNIVKLRDRAARGKLQGSGDNR